MLHSKTIIVDQQYSLIGTANFDPRSFRLNFEVCVMAYGDKLADMLSRQFERDLTSSERVLPGRTTGLIHQLAEAIARLFSPLL